MRVVRSGRAVPGEQWRWWLWRCAEGAVAAAPHRLRLSYEGARRRRMDEVVRGRGWGVAQWGMGEVGAGREGR